MKWSLKLGRYFGIDVYLHLTFLLLLAFVGLQHWLSGQGILGVLMGVLFFVSLFICVLLHEFGHALMAQKYGIPTRDITLLPIGGLARLERMPDEPRQELLVALAGPAVNVLIALGLFLGLQFHGGLGPLAQLSPVAGPFAERLLYVNVFLVLFNLLPAFPMDGGRVLRALLAMRMDYARATRIAATIGKGMAVIFGFVGLFKAPMLILIAVFVWIGASQEAEAAEEKASFTGLTVRDAMLTQFRTLQPQETLGDVARLILSGMQQDFPVVEQDRVIGVVTHARFFAALKQRGDGAPVAEIMVRDFQCANHGESLDAALTRCGAKDCAVLPVLRDGQLVGLLTPENIGEFIMIQAALGTTRARRWTAPPPLLPEEPRPAALVPPVLPFPPHSFSDSAAR